MDSKSHRDMIVRSMHALQSIFVSLLTTVTAVSADSPLGDTCADAIPCEVGTAIFDSSEHTDSGLPVLGNCIYMGEMSRDIWYTYAPSVDGIVTASTCDAESFDTSIMVYKAECNSCDVLEYIACNGDAQPDAACQVYHSQVDFIASAGTEYLLRIGGYSSGEGGPGTLTMSIQLQEDPCNCPADINSDRAVNTDDLLRVIAQWTQTDDPADIDCSGTVDLGDLLMVIADWGSCSTDYIFNDTFELPVPAEVDTNGIFAVWWAPQFDHFDDTPIMFKQLNAIREDCINNLGMRDPPNPESCFYYNIYVHHGEADDYPNGWANGQGTDSNGMPFLTLPAGLNTDPANTFHEGFHIFQYQASSPGFAYAGDSQWYIESTAQWYMAWNMPGDVSAFVEAAAITANPQLALWHSFSNEAPGDPIDWYYQVRQYGMHTLLYYLVQEEGVDPANITNGFYAGTDLSPQAYLSQQIGLSEFREQFANWAARNTGGLDYLTPEQVERAIAEAKWVGDPDTAHPYIVEIATSDIEETWTFEPCIGSPDGPDPDCQEPRGWAYNVIRIDNNHQGRMTFSLDGDPIGTQGAPATFRGRIVAMGEGGTRYSNIDMTDALHGSGWVDVTSDDDEVFLVIVSVPDTFSTYQRYGYRATITLGPPGP